MTKNLDLFTLDAVIQALAVRIADTTDTKHKGGLIHAQNLVMKMYGDTLDAASLFCLQEIAEENP